MNIVIQAKILNNKMIADPLHLITNKTPQTVRKRKREDANLLETKKLDTYFSIQSQNYKESLSEAKTPHAKKIKTRVGSSEEPKIQMTFKDGLLNSKVNSQPVACRKPFRLFENQKCQTQSQNKITSTQTASLKSLRREYFKKFCEKFENKEFLVFSSLFVTIGDQLKDAGYSVATFESIFVSALALFLASSTSQQMHAIFRPSSFQELIDDQACMFVVYWITQYFKNQKRETEDNLTNAFFELSNSFSLHFDQHKQKNDVPLPKRYQDCVNDLRYNCLVVKGSEGIGKATLVLTACKELNCQVIEFNNSCKRSSKELDSILEATQSHNVKKGFENLLLSAKTLSSQNSDDPVNVDRTVILLRNYDKMLEPDHGFCEKTNKLIKNSKCPIILTSSKKYPQFDSLEFEGYDDDELAIFFYTILQIYHNFESQFENLRRENQAFESSESVDELISKIQESERSVSVDSMSLRGNIEKIRLFIQFQKKNLTCLFTLFEQFKALFIAKENYHENIYSLTFLDRNLPVRSFRWFGELTLEDDFLKEVFLVLEKRDRKVVLHYSDLIENQNYSFHETVQDIILAKPITCKASYNREEYKAKCLLNLHAHQRILDSLGDLDALQEKINCYHYNQEVESFLFERKQKRKRNHENSEIDLEKKWSCNNYPEGCFNDISAGIIKNHVLNYPRAEPIASEDTFTVSLRTLQQVKAIHYQKKLVRSWLLLHGSELSYIANKDLADFSELFTVVGNTYSPELQTRSQRRKTRESNKVDQTMERELIKQHYFDKSLLAKSCNPTLTTNFMRLSKAFYNQKIYEDFSNYMDSSSDL